jgi:inner membrane protein
MPTVFTHAFSALALGKVCAASKMPARFWVLAALCAALPDADVVAFAFGIPYNSTFGHRGFTHSLAFALLLGATVVAIFFREAKHRAALVIFFFLATASHGALDALTNGGLGVAFLAPFSDARYFFPARPIELSPIGVGSFLSERGVVVIGSELLRVWLPSSLVVAAVLIFRRMRGGTTTR